MNPRPESADAVWRSFFAPAVGGHREVSCEWVEATADTTSRSERAGVGHFQPDHRIDRPDGCLENRSRADPTAVFECLLSGVTTLPIWRRTKKNTIMEGSSSH
jgi:hypothetical protein